ncbi:MAG: isochorismatase family cysteine hydrolase [Pseudomonadota bacterium]
MKKILVLALILALSVPAMVQARQIDLLPSGSAAGGPVVPYVETTPPYAINPAKTALFVIDPQIVYSAPFTIDPAELALGKSPLHCENFDAAMANVTSIVRACAAKNIPVFLIRHVYEPDGCNCGRLCDFDPLGGLGFPKAWNLWRRDLIFSEFDARVQDIKNILNADGDNYFYAEKSIFSSFTRPVVGRLVLRGIDTVIITGFMTQYCSVSATRHGHDLGYKIVYVKDANDGPQLGQILTTDPAGTNPPKYPQGIDENDAIPFYLSIPVADVTDTAGIVARINR